MINKKRYYIFIQISIIVILSILIYRLELIHQIERFSLWAFPKNENRNGEVTKLILNIFGGIFVLFGLFAAIRRARASEKAVEVQSESIKNQTNQIQLTRIAQVNELFKNAIEHLGSDSEPIILGGISELHFIASENEKKFSQVVLNILCNKVRAEANVKKDANNISKTIVQTIIDYIFKTNVYNGLNSDLSNCNLNNIDINDTEIENCNLSFSIIPWQINNVILRNSNLGSINSNVARFSKLTIINCNLFHAFFRAGEFSEVKILDTTEKIQSLVCLDTTFKDVEFSCKLFNSKFIACEFQESRFNTADLMNINFSGTSFKNINFSQVEISGCDFTAAGFVNVTTNTWIQNCKFKGIKNTYSYYCMFFKKQIEASKANENDFTGLKYEDNYFIKNEVSNLDEGDMIYLIKIYEDIISKEKKRMSNTKH